VGAKAFPGGSGIESPERLAFVVQSAQKWLWRREIVQRAFAVHPGPKLLLRYEAILSDPPEGVRKLLAWLELPADALDLASTIERHAFERLPAEQRGPQAFHRAASPGLWRENLSVTEQHAAERIMGPKLRELGSPNEKRNMTDRSVRRVGSTAPSAHSVSADCLYGTNGSWWTEGDILLRVLERILSRRNQTR